MTPEYAELLQELHNATSANRVNWQRTSAEDQFIVYFTKVSITIRFFDSENDPNRITFTIRDEAGKIIDQIWIDETEDGWRPALETYSVARRRALGIDTALQSILSELRTGKQVGEEAPTVSADDDDEVPF